MKSSFWKKWDLVFFVIMMIFVINDLRMGMFGMAILQSAFAAFFGYLTWQNYGAQIKGFFQRKSTTSGQDNQ